MDRSSSEEAEGSYVYRWETCVICFEPVKGGREGVYLSCHKHCFYGSCIVPHLQRGHRCPVCRQTPTSSQEDVALDTLDTEAAIDTDYQFNYETTVLYAISLTNHSTARWCASVFQRRKIGKILRPVWR
jgi:hypothetical protein